MTAPAALLPAPIPGLELLPNERISHTFRPDVDEALQFSAGLVLLSDTRVLARETDGSFRAIPLTSSLELVRTEHVGLTELTLSERGQRLLRIRYTLALAAAGNDF